MTLFIPIALILTQYPIPTPGAFSCSLGDTLASELGTVLAKSDPFLITTWRRVPRGTNGGVSFPGLMVSGLGGLIIGFSYLISLYLFVDREKVIISYAQWPILLITFLDGLFGSLLGECFYWGF